MNTDKIRKLAEEVIVAKLGYVYCHNCKSNDPEFEEYCEDCNRKAMGWSISEQAASEIADAILQAIGGKQ